MTTVTTSGSRQARAAATRARILGAAHDLFVANGYRATSLRDIAAAASVSHPGLLGHFPSKDSLLAEVVAALETANERLLGSVVDASEPGEMVFAQVAERNARTPGYLALFAALTGEASTPRHPAHERMRARYARLRALTVDVLDDARHQGALAPDRDPVGESIRHMAGWDGLQLLAQYLPEQIDIADMLEERESLWALPLGWREDEAPDADARRSTALPEFLPVHAPEAEQGYAAGRRRRAQIVADAMRLFARDGYGDTSLRDVADAAGVSKSTLLHHYPTKELLLSAVLAERDAQIRMNGEAEGVTCAADVLRSIPQGAAINAVDEPGLIEVYAVLSCEAVPEGHPAHAYFTQRLSGAIEYFAELFRLAQLDGDLPEHRDPTREATWLIALWDGLQYQWLYDRDAVDVAAQLHAHLQDVLPPSATPAR